MHSSRILRRLEEVSNHVKKQQDAIPHHYHFAGYQPDMDVRDFSLQASDIEDKVDILTLSNMLREWHKGNSPKDRIRVAVVTHFFHSYTGYATLGLTDEELFHFIQNWKDYDNSSTFLWSMNRMFNLLTKRINEKGVNDILKKTLLLFHTPEGQYMYTDHKSINQSIEYILQEPSPVQVNRFDEWGQEVIVFIENAPNELKNPWTALLNYLLTISPKSTPPKKWEEKARQLIAAIPDSSFNNQMIEWISFVSSLLQAIHKNERQGFLRDVNHDLLKAMIWCCGLLNDASLNAVLDSYATLAYKKKPNVGSLSLKTGNACMLAFSFLPFKEAVTRLMKFRNKTTNNTIIKSIDKIIADLAKKHGYAKDLVEEIGVMDFNLDSRGEKKLVFENSTCTIRVTRTSEVETLWEKDGKPVKSVPAQVKVSYAAQLKQLKLEVTEIAAQLQVQKNRIESYYLRKKKWEYSDWIEKYISHSLVRTITSRLIWTFTTGEKQMTGILLEDKWVDAHGDQLSDIGELTQVELWHPIDADVDEIVSWRNFIQQHQITQPFKQAYREIYLLTEAELRTNTYSNRFAAHVLKQHQFAALCKQRNWSYHLMGNWDSHNTPTIVLPDWQMTAQYYVDANAGEDLNESFIYLYITTDQVRFYQDGEQLELIDVPKLVFSEIMRDVDLFVGVTSIGNDPEWLDGGERRYGDYWRDYSFGDLGESAKMRKEVLQNLVHRLKIRDVCSVDGKFLIVKGKLRTYKIHMGSGNILMEPDDQYLCIVPEGRKDDQKLYLPFEGDRMLSIIISKALMLAEDDKIKDESITRQLSR